MNFKKSLRLLFLFLIVTGCLLPLSPDIARPDTEENREKALQRINFNRLLNSDSKSPSFLHFDQRFEQLLRKNGIPGASVAVMKDGKLLMAKGYGLADTATKELVSPAHLFRVGSVSKLVTAIGIMKLVEEGKLSLDDFVFGKRGILNDPQFLKIKDRKTYSIRVRHLLEHTAGWSKSEGDPMFDVVRIGRIMKEGIPAEPETVIKYVLRQKLRYTPGTQYYYSNVGYSVLGRIIEKLSGVSYEQYIEDVVLTPLGIEGARIGASSYNDKAPLEVAYYDYDRAGKRASCFEKGKLAARTYEGTYIEGLDAAGGWIFNPSQLLRIVASIDGDPTVKDILSLESVGSMTNADTKYYGYAHGWAGTNPMYWYRTGTLAGTSAYVARRADGFSFAVIINKTVNYEEQFTKKLHPIVEELIEMTDGWPDRDLFKN